MNTLLAFSLPSGPELLFIFLIVLILFGARRLPELARGLGQSVKEFRRAKQEFDEELTNTGDDLTIREAQHKQQASAAPTSGAGVKQQPSQTS